MYFLWPCSSQARSNDVQCAPGPVGSGLGQGNGYDLDLRSNWNITNKQTNKQTNQQTNKQANKQYLKHQCTPKSYERNIGQEIDMTLGHRYKKCDIPIQVVGSNELITPCNFQSAWSSSLALTPSQSCKEVTWGRVIQTNLVTWPSKVTTCT